MAQGGAEETPPPETPPVESSPLDQAAKAAPAATSGTAATALAAAIAAGLAASALLAAFRRVLKALRLVTLLWMTRELGLGGRKLVRRAGLSDDDLFRLDVLAGEARLTKLWDARVEERVREKLDAIDRKHGRGKSPARKKAIEDVFSAERTFAGQRARAVAARTHGASDVLRLRTTDPVGAAWVLGEHVSKHTKGCLHRAGHVYPWAVLMGDDYPPAHYGCGCRLEPRRRAKRNGWVTSIEPLSTADAKARLARARALNTAEGAPPAR